MDLKEISDIIDLCKRAGVSKFSLGDLCLEFGRPTKSELSATAASEQALSDEVHLRQTKESLELRELRLRENQLEELLLTDPLKYEELILNGELVDGDEAGQSDAGS